MRDYCRKISLKINLSGKLVVAKNENELDTLYELYERGKTNKVDVKLIDETEAKKIDPNAKTYQKALHSPTTSTIDPTEICLCIRKELESKGVTFYFNESFKKRIADNQIVTSRGRILEAGKVINTAGLYADKIAKDFGFSKNYDIIPFKGLYLGYSNPDQPVETNIYPVPDLRNPFLGVHFTITADGHIKFGPTSTPAFWRENYKGFKNFRFREFLKIIFWEARLFLTNAFGFRNLAISEVKKYSRRYFTNLAKDLVYDLDLRGFKEWTKPGIRAQLINVHTKELVQDYVVEGDENSVHILNAVSPAFTSSFPFARWIVGNYIAPGKD